ncbi:MAG: trigger factor [Deltaproteobacteria bacterium]|nr:MAG: trigger factor [Deltaproteobacteria bacterium]
MGVRVPPFAPAGDTMPYELETKPNHTVAVSAYLDPEAVEEERTRLLKRLARRVRIPGFRPGKAPLKVVRARLGHEIEEDLQESLARRAWAEVLEGEEGLEPISDFRIRRAEVEEDGTFRLEGEVDVRPRWELPDPEGLELPEFSIEVTDEEVDEQLERMAERHAQWEPVEDGEAEDGMVAEARVGVEFPEGDGEPFDLGEVVLLLGEARLGEKVDEALQGARPGETREAETQVPGDHPDERIAGKTVRYRVEVRTLRRKVLPEIDEGFAKTVGAESLEELRAKVREALEREKRTERRRTWRRALLDQLERDIDPESVPPSVVDAALKARLESLAFELMMRGIDPSSGAVDWNQVAAEARPDARKAALDRLVLEQLADQWGIEVPEKDVEAVVREEARRAGVPVGEYRAKMEAEGRLAELREGARLARAVDELIRRAGGEVE